MAFRYQTLAHTLKLHILHHHLAPHTKLISLRQFAKQHQVSLSTAQACYEHLEAQGLIYSKHKSGYFVAPHQRDMHPNNSRYTETTFPSVIRSVSNLDLYNQILQASFQPNVIQLGSIQLGPQLIPMQQLKVSLQRALKHCKNEDFLYCNQQGHIHLQTALQQHWATDNIHIAVQDIFITHGCTAALSLAIQSLSKVGDSIIIPTPTFNGQLHLLAHLNRKIIEIPATTAGLDLERLEAVMATKQSQVCLLTANFQNPLGYCLSHADKKTIADLAAKYQCYIIEDDVYAECSYHTERPLPIKYWDDAGYVIWVGSVSKSLSSAYRVGWLCLSKQIQHLKPNILANNVVVNTPLQLGLADFIFTGAYKKHIRALQLKLYEQVRDFVHTIHVLFTGCDIELSMPQGGYAIWIKLPNQLSSLSLYQDALKHGISISPGILFGEDHKYQSFIRLNAGAPMTDQIHQALKYLAEWIQARQ